MLTSFGRLVALALGWAEAGSVRAVFTPGSPTDFDTDRTGHNVTGSTILLPFVITSVGTATGLDEGNGKPEEKFNAKMKPCRGR
jgi:hypothetical protein